MTAKALARQHGWARAPLACRRWTVALSLGVLLLSGCRAPKSQAARASGDEEVPAAAAEEGQGGEEGAPAGQANEDGVPPEPAADGEAAIEGADEPIEEDVEPEVSAAELEVLTQLREQAGRLDQNKLVLAKREAELKRVESELQNRLDRINELEDRLQRELGIGKAAEDRRDERVNGLAELVMTMPPQSGAEMLAQMPNLDAQAIILAIYHKNSRKAAKVLAQMPPERAAQLSSLYLESDPKMPGSDDLVPRAPAKFDGVNPTVPPAAPANPANPSPSASKPTEAAAKDPAAPAANPAPPASGDNKSASEKKP